MVGNIIMKKNPEYLEIERNQRTKINTADWNIKLKVNKLEFNS